MRADWRRYDQGVLSAILTLDDFQRTIKLMAPFSRSSPVCFDAGGNRDYNQCLGDANTQAAGVAIYQIGCFLGAVLILFYGERWGRRSSTFWGSFIMIIGTIMQAASFEYGLFVAGRVVGGVGNGMVTSSASPLPYPLRFVRSYTSKLFLRGRASARDLSSAAYSSCFLAP